MRVVLIAHTVITKDIPGYELLSEEVADCDDLSEQAGRLCYLSFDRPNPKTAGNDDYIANILNQGHYSVLEHGSATFYIDGVTRAFLLELERHRHFSYSVVSQRYCDGSRFKLVEHPELAKLSDDLKKRIADVQELNQQLYADIVTELEALGDNRKTARGAARTILPEGTETRLLVTGNIRAWREMLIKRLSPAADAEIRQVAQLILAQLMEVAPASLQDFNFETA